MIHMKSVLSIFDVILIQQLAMAVTVLTLAPTTRKEAWRTVLSCSKHILLIMKVNSW